MALAKADRRVILVLVALSSATLAGTAPALPAVASIAQDDSTESVHLPAAAEPGQGAVLKTSISHVTDIGEIEVMVKVSSSVLDVSDEGSYVIRSTIDDLNHSAPAGEDLSDLDSLESIAFDRSFNANGTLVPGSTSFVGAAGLSAAQRDGGRDVLDSIAVVRVGFPDEPVSVGSAWTTPGRVGSHGLVIDVSYQCRLVALTDSEYTVEVSYAQSFNGQRPGGGAVDGTISGSGALSGSLVNPLVVGGTVWQTLDGIETFNGTSTPLQSDMTIAVAPVDG